MDDNVDANRQKLIDEFMLVTEGDRNQALEYLRKHSWKVVEAINDFFEWMHDDYCRKENEKQEQQQKANDDKTEDDNYNEGNEEVPVVEKKFKTRNSNTNNDNTDDENGESSSKQLRLFRHITYNIDSLNERNLQIRIKAICDIILEEKGTIIFLQEVRNESELIIREKLSKYFEIYSGFMPDSTDYYTMTLIAKKSWIKIDDGKKIINFPDTKMGRNILKSEITVDDAKICLINTHLESGKEFCEIRQQQLSYLMRIIDSIDKQTTVIVAGDLNLRDKDVSAIGGLPVNVQDAWIATGRRKEVQYTWDMMRNDNLNFSEQLSSSSKYVRGKIFKPRMRFDRVYIRCTEPTSKIDIVHFGLIGLKRLKPYVCFPSDHWGIITSYQIY